MKKILILITFVLSYTTNILAQHVIYTDKYNVKKEIQINQFQLDKLEKQKNTQILGVVLYTSCLVVPSVINKKISPLAYIPSALLTYSSIRLMVTLGKIKKIKHSEWNNKHK